MDARNGLARRGRPYPERKSGVEAGRGSHRLAHPGPLVRVGGVQVSPSPPAEAGHRPASLHSRSIAARVDDFSPMS